MNEKTRRDIAFFVWEREWGKPYVWGGNDPVAGFDCSGFVIEGLKSAGLLPRSGDWRAADLATLFPRTLDIRPGVLLFWLRGTEIGHVEVVAAVLDGTIITIGASGGGSKTLTREDAILSDAYVKLRVAEPGWVRAVDPFHGEGG